MSTCVKCGNKAVRTEEYMIGSRDTFSFVKFEGAAEIGCCTDCATLFARKLSKKKLLVGMVPLAFGLFFLIIAFTSGLDGNIVAFAIMITCLGSGLFSILSYIGLGKKLSAPEQYVKEIEASEYMDIISKTLNDVPEIKERVILNWSALKDNPDIDNITDPVFQAKIRMPFQIGTTGKVEICGIGNMPGTGYFPIPGYGVDKSLNEKELELIRQVVITYQREHQKY